MPQLHEVPLPSTPSVLAPKAQTVPSDSSAALVTHPVDTCRTVPGSPVTWTGEARSNDWVPSPSWPQSLDPKPKTPGHAAADCDTVGAAAAGTAVPALSTAATPAAASTIRMPCDPGIRPTRFLAGHRPASSSMPPAQTGNPLLVRQPIAAWMHLTGRRPHRPAPRTA